MQVQKRSGGLQDIDLNKIHLVLDRVCNGDPNLGLKAIKNTSVSAIELMANTKFYEGITTTSINESTIKAAADLISEDTPSYDHVAARLRWLGVRKDTCGSYLVKPLIWFIETNTALGYYDPDLRDMYSDQEWKTIDSFIDHSRDDLFRYAGSEQMHKKYLVQDRQTRQVFETYQIPYILVSAILFHEYSGEERMQAIKVYYDLVSQHYVSLPTPLMAGLRTSEKQFSSCVLISSGDSRDSINAAASAIVDYASRKAGIGLNIGAIRAQGQKVRKGDAVSTGVIPFAKYFNAALKSCSQGAIRGASCTMNWPIFHLEFPALIELKNVKGTEENRIRTVDYCVHLNKTMYERLIQKGDITFFSPEEVPDLYEAFYGPPENFKVLYEQYEKDPTKTKRTMAAIDVFTKLATERFETGRIYILNADHVNSQSPFLESVKMTNLCTEILQVTEHMSKDQTKGRIALCTLSALNWGKIDTESEMELACNMAVRALDRLLDYQDYPLEEARLHTQEYRPLGIGIIGFAHYLAKNSLVWGSPETLQAVHDKMEQMAYYLTKASIDLASENPDYKFSKPTRYSQGIFPKDLATFGLEYTLKMDWDSLKERVLKHGIRNSTLMALMPSETSSQLANETNGIEPPKGLITIKGSKDGTMAQVVPEINKLNHAYQLAWDVPVSDYLKTLAIMQKFIDQAISTNTTYNPAKQQISTGVILSDILLAYKLGTKCLYYSNVLDEDPNVEEDTSCESGACKI